MQLSSLFICCHLVFASYFTGLFCFAAHPDPQQTEFSVHGNFLVVRCGKYECVSMSPQDCYKNTASIAPDLVWLDVCKVSCFGMFLPPLSHIVTQLHTSEWHWTCLSPVQNHANGPGVISDCIVEQDKENPGRYEILLKLNEPGYYVGCVRYGESVLGLHNLQIFCLSGEDLVLVKCMWRTCLSLPRAQASATNMDVKDRVYYFSLLVYTHHSFGAMLMWLLSLYGFMLSVILRIALLRRWASWDW